MNNSSILSFSAPARALFPSRRIGVFLILVSLFLISHPVYADSPPEVMTRYDHPGVLKIGHSRTTTNTLEVWLAVGIETWPESENMRYNVLTEDGKHLKGRAWDTGRFAGKWVETPQGNADIVFDLFCKWWLWGDDTSVIIVKWWAEADSVWWGKL